MFIFIGILAGIVFVLGDIPYIWDTIKSKTKPHRVTWLIFFVLDLIYLANQLALGAKGSLLLVIAWTVVTFIIFMLSLKKGVGGLAQLDIVCLLGAVLGLFLWWLLKSPLASVILNNFVSLLGYIPTFKKAYLHPETETKISWLTAFFAATLQLISVGGAEIQTALTSFLQYDDGRNHDNYTLHQKYVLRSTN